mmetsp:Transcript_128605/g.274352  ORF Transcript_128605/g.274352 Transcript_128605/m.274352 type:complete len:240 (-) Transcript_128605:1004-1723(-)
MCDSVPRPPSTVPCSRVEKVCAAVRIHRRQCRARGGHHALRSAECNAALFDFDLKKLLVIDDVPLAIPYDIDTQVRGAREHLEAANVRCKAIGIFLRGHIAVSRIAKAHDDLFEGVAQARERHAEAATEMRLLDACGHGLGVDAHLAALRVQGKPHDTWLLPLFGLTVDGRLVAALLAHELAHCKGTGANLLVHVCLFLLWDVINEADAALMLGRRLRRRWRLVVLRVRPTACSAVPAG